jgi:hypothetical protein
MAWFLPSGNCLKNGFADALSPEYATLLAAVVKRFA